MTTTDKTTIQELQQKITLLKDRARDASTLKTQLENNINDLYAKPLNDRQMMQFMLAAVDERAAAYKENILKSEFFEAPKILNQRPLSFDDFEQIQGRGRVLGVNSSPSDADLLFKLEFIKTYDVGTHTWMPYFFGELIKQKIVELYHRKRGKTALEALESIEDRSAQINGIHRQLMKLDEDLNTINSEIDAVSKPVFEFMSVCR